MIKSKKLAKHIDAFIIEKIEEQFPMCGNWGSLYYWEGETGQTIEELFEEAINSYQE
jgi:hypothetical protein